MNQEAESESADIIPPIEYLRECFRYDPESGKLFWKERPDHHFQTAAALAKYRKYFIGKEFGHVEYQRTTKRVACLMGRLSYRGSYTTLVIHRTIWMMHNGPIPPLSQIDHIDGDASNNRLNNLRLATPSQNIANAADYRKRKYNLPRGVHKNGKKFSALTRKDGKLIWIGSFATPEEAHAAYLKKAAEVHGVFFRYSEPSRIDQEGS